MKKAALILLSFIFAFGVFFSTASADEYSDLEKKINQKNSEFSQTQSNLESIKKQISSLSGSVYANSAQLEEANKQVVLIREELARVDTALNKQKDELQEIIDVRDEQVRSLYKHPGDNVLELFIVSGGFANFSRTFGLQTKVLSTTKDLVTLANEEVSQVQKIRNEINNSRKSLEATATSIQAQLDSQRKSLSYAYSRQSSLNRGLELIQSDITRALIRKSEIDEQRRAGNLSGAPSVPISPGPPGSTYYFFYGTGRDSYMGHGVGMSQYGAQGYAIQGWSYQDILRKYYTGVSVSDYAVSRADQGGVYDDSRWKITVAGYGQMTYKQYLEGIGEIPSSWNWNINTYAALITAARTYALRFTGGDPNVTICRDANCQVYQGGSAKASAVVMTRNKVVKSSDGSLATTLYSADHGGHSENNENVFQWWNSNSNVYSYSAYPYLRGVSDADANFSFPNMGYADWAHWGWNTKYSYTISQVRDILRKQLAVRINGICTDKGQNSWIDRSVGTLTSLGIERGVSGRVAWIVLYGTSGSARIPGKVFKSAFNNLPCDGSPAANADDVMYSTKFSIGSQVR